MSNGTRERKLKVKRGAKKMERLGITGYGPAIEVFKRITAEPRELTANHIRVKMKAFGINPYDIALRSGSMQEVRKLTFPYVLGNDGAGIVTEVAADVQSFKVGDRVAVHPISGAYGEKIVLPVGKAAKIPEKMSWSEAAAIVTPGVTAYNLINHLLDLQPTDTVMIEGASGAVGTSLIQLLHIRGIRTFASASKKNEEKIRQLGVSDFSAYDQEDPGIKFQNQADTVIDATKGSVKGESGIQIMKEGGRYIALNDLPSLELRQKKTGFYEPFIPRKEYQDQEAFTHLFNAYQNGDFHIFVGKELPATLENVIWAHQQVEGHSTTGKIILTFD